MFDEKKQPKELEENFVNKFLEPLHKINKKLEHETDRVEILKTFVKHKVESGVDMVRWTMKKEYKPKNFKKELKEAFVIIVAFVILIMWGNNFLKKRRRK